MAKAFTKFCRGISLKLCLAAVTSILIYIYLSASKKLPDEDVFAPQIPVLNANFDESAIENRECVQRMRQNVSRCLRQRLTTAPSLWLAINSAIGECCVDLVKKVQMIKIENIGDFKFIILPHRSAENKQFYEKETCNLLTIGEEQNLNEILANCSMCIFTVHTDGCTHTYGCGGGWAHIVGGGDFLGGFHPTPIAGLNFGLGGCM